MYDSNNVFAKILRGELPSKKIYENEYALSFHNIDPKSRIHALIIPKGEYKNILEFTTRASLEEQSGFWTAVHETVKALGVSEEFRVLANTGAYQSIMHFHIHLMNDDKYMQDGL